VHGHCIQIKLTNINPPPLQIRGAALGLDPPGTVPNLILGVGSETPICLPVSSIPQEQRRSRGFERGAAAPGASRGGRQMGSNSRIVSAQIGSTFCACANFSPFGPPPPPPD